MSEWIAFGEEAFRFLFLNWGLQATVILAASLLLSRLPRLSPSQRHVLLATGLAMALLAPLATVVRGLLPTAAVAAPSQVRVLGYVLPVSEASPAPRRASSPPAPPSGAPDGLGWILLATWTAVAGGRLAWLLLGIISVRRSSRRAAPVDPDLVYQACKSMLADVPVLEAAGVSVPSVSGLWRPRIILPLGLAAQLDQRTLRAVLLHEEAHARRRDPAFLCGAAFCHAVLFWHPLTTLARRRLEAAAEDACDAYVLSRGVEPTAYARTLLSVLEHARPRRSAVTCLLGWAPASTGAAGELKRRITLILAGGSPRSRAAGWAASAGLTTLVVGTLVAEVGTRPLPPVSRAKPALAAAMGRRQHFADAPKPSVDGVVGSAAKHVLKDAAARMRRPVQRGLAAAGPLPEARPAPVAVPVSAPRLAQARMVAPQEGRTVVYLLDVSSSMRPYQAEAQRQLLALASGLSPVDRFNVLVFAAEVDRFAWGPVPVSESSLESARQWLADLPERSGTDLAEALQAALETPGLTRVVVVSDGEGWKLPQSRTALASLLERENARGVEVEELVLGPTDPDLPQLAPDTRPQPAPRPTLEADEHQRLKAP